MPPESYFVDTSALFKRYVQETGSDIIENIFAAETSRFISVITTVEVVSNLRRLVALDGVLSEEEFGIVKAMFFQDIAENRLELVDITAATINKSLDICTDQYVTPLDSLQLAAALTMAEKPYFVCSDKKLIRLAEAEGLTVIDPNSA